MWINPGGTFKWSIMVIAMMVFSLMSVTTTAATQPAGIASYDAKVTNNHATATVQATNLVVLRQSNYHLIEIGAGRSDDKAIASTLIPAVYHNTADIVVKRLAKTENGSQNIATNETSPAPGGAGLGGSSLVTNVANANLDTLAAPYDTGVD